MGKRIYHFIGGSLEGGAAKGAIALHLKLLENNIESYVINNSKIYQKINIPNLINIENTKDNIRRKLNLGLKQVILSIYRNRKGRAFTMGLFSLGLKKLNLKPDSIIHIHWLGDSFINYDVIKSLASKHKIIFTLRDMWAFTGGCHYTLKCKKYQTGCGQCIELGSSFKYDLSWVLFKRKATALRGSSIEYVAISRWLQQQAQNSKLLIHENVHYIANLTAPTFYKAHKLNKKYEIKYDVLLGAKYVLASYKGYKELLEIINDRSELKTLRYAFFGEISSIDKKAIQNMIPTSYFFDSIQDEKKLIGLYKSSRVYVAPSKQEAFGKTALESILCGTPVVAFKNTGIESIIDHKQNGYLANYLDFNDIINGIYYCMNRELNVIIKDDLKPQHIVNEYLNLYN